MKLTYFCFVSSIGIRIISFVDRLTSAAALTEYAPGNHPGIFPRAGIMSMKLAPGGNSLPPERTALSATMTQGSSNDLASYPYIEDNGIDIESLRISVSCSALVSLSYSVIRTSYYDRQSFPEFLRDLEASRVPFWSAWGDIYSLQPSESSADKFFYAIAICRRVVAETLIRSIPSCDYQAFKYTRRAVPYFICDLTVLLLELPAYQNNYLPASREAQSHLRLRSR